MNTLKSISQAILDHKILLAYIISMVLIVFIFFGCRAHTLSLYEPDTRVTRKELLAEVDLFLARAQSRIDELDKKEEILRAIAKWTSYSLETGDINPSGLLVTLLGLFGAGTIGNYAGKTQIKKRFYSDDTPPEA